MLAEGTDSKSLFEKARFPSGCCVIHPLSVWFGTDGIGSLTPRTMSDRILPGASQAPALHMKAPAGLGRPGGHARSRKAVRVAQGLTHGEPKPSFAMKW